MKNKSKFNIFFTWIKNIFSLFLKWIKGLFKKQTPKYVTSIKSFASEAKSFDSHHDTLIKAPVEEERYLTIVAENKSDEEFYLDIFSSSNTNLPKDITLQFLETGEILDTLLSIKANKRFVHGLRYSVTTAKQLSKWIEIKRVTPFGEVHIIPLEPIRFKTAYQNQMLQIDAPGYRFPLNDETRIGIRLLPKEKIDLVFQINNTDTSRERLTSGIVQINN